MVFRFLEFKVYQDAKDLNKRIVRITNKFPKDFEYLKKQIRRSSLSVVLNIAEGSAKVSDKDFNRYLENSMGSVNETAAGLDVSFSEGLVSKEIFDDLIALCSKIVRQLGGFSKKLKVGS